MGISNTLATITGILSPLAASAIAKDVRTKNLSNSQRQYDHLKRDGSSDIRGGGVRDVQNFSS